MLNLVRVAPLLKLVWTGPVCSNLSRQSIVFSLYSKPAGLSLAAAALAQLLSAMLVTAVATDVRALTTLSVLVAVLARDDPSPRSAGLIVAICPTQRQNLCLRHILLRLGRLEGGSPWPHGRRWPQEASPRNSWAESPHFISEAPDTYLYLAFLLIFVPQ